MFKLFLLLLQRHDKCKIMRFLLISVIANLQSLHLKPKQIQIGLDRTTIQHQARTNNAQFFSWGCKKLEATVTKAEEALSATRPGLVLCAVSNVGPV